MENVLYNDLIRRGMNVDVGVVEYNTKDANGKKIRKQLEVDFVVNQGGKRFYVQSALSIADPEKKEQEIASLKRIPDSFSKIVVVRDYLKPWQDENGITYVGIEQFLLNEDLLKWYIYHIGKRHLHVRLTDKDDTTLHESGQWGQGDGSLVFLTQLI